MDKFNEFVNALLYNMTNHSSIIVQRIDMIDENTVSLMFTISEPYLYSQKSEVADYLLDKRPYYSVMINLDNFSDTNLRHLCIKEHIKSAIEKLKKSVSEIEDMLYV